MSTHVHDWRAIDIGRMCYECGEIEEQMSGTHMPELIDLVLKSLMEYPFVTCEATVVRHCEDPGVLCGKPVVPGTPFCKEHSLD